MRGEIASLGFPKERIHVIPNSAVLPETPALDPAVRAAARSRLGLGEEPLVVFAGRLSSEKGLEILLDAWPRVLAVLPEARLLLLGEGGAFRSVEAELRRQCAALGLQESVRFLGHVSDVQSYLLACDAFVLPTRTEGMSNSLVEAMAAGCAIVTTDIAAHEGLVDHGEHALLVPAGDAAACAGALVTIVSDRARADRLRRNARAKAERDLSVPVMLDRYFALYAEVSRRP